MALIDSITTAWSAPIALTSDEIWQVRDGQVFVTTTAVPDADDGVMLAEGEALQIRAGQSVRYRKTADTYARLVRETV